MFMRGDRWYHKKQELPIMPVSPVMEPQEFDEETEAVLADTEAQAGPAELDDSVMTRKIGRI
jgi:hypothetical protein